MTCLPASRSPTRNRRTTPPVSPSSGTHARYVLTLLVVILNNFFGRQFNSLNDVTIHRPTGDIFFTDVTYGFVRMCLSYRTRYLRSTDSRFPSDAWSAQPDLPVQRIQR